MLEFIGHGLFLVLGIMIGASIMYFGEPDERPQGEWEVLADKYNVQTCKCSICGRIEVISHYRFDEIPFCHCGAEMKGGAE